MPPQLNSDEEESDGPDLIPAKGPIPVRAEVAEEVDEDDEDDDEDDEDGEEYRVEQILSHRFVGKAGVIEYEIKWLGYDKKADRTWEPIGNLDNAMDLVNEYHDSIGGAPISGKAEASSNRKSGGGTSKSNKRPSAALFDSPAVQPSAKKRAKANGAPTSSQFPPGSWEDHVLRVHTVLEETDPDAQGPRGKGKKELLGLIEWTDEKKTQHPLHVLRRKCPQKMLDYYEQHLVFRSATSKDEAEADAAASIED